MGITPSDVALVHRIRISVNEEEITNISNRIYIEDINLRKQPKKLLEHKRLETSGIF